jgi:diguanylate cyclase (GGDEF)-like protein/PAS domain S-box-containing protein
MAAAGPTEATRPRVLVVDDHLQEALDLQRALAADVELLCVGDGQRGLELVLTEPNLAAVIASPHMRLANGQSFLEALRESAAIPRILLSDCSDPEQLVAAVNEQRVFAFARRPLSAKQLLPMLRAAVAQHAAERADSRDRQLLQQLMHSVPEAIYFKDRELRYVLANPACAALHGVDSPRSLEGMRDAELAQGAGPVPNLEAGQRMALARGEALPNQVTRYVRDGQLHWLSATHAPLSDAAGNVTGLVGIARDVTASKRREDELNQQISDLALIAHYDELTHLPKRGLLMDRLRERLTAASSGNSIALVLLDIDRFRRINVSFGRDAGDTLIFAIVSRLRPLLGSDDTLARLDGNTFAWLIADARESSHVVARLERDVLPRLRAPYRLDEAELRVSCRIGVAVGPTDGESAELLIQHAEAALNKAAASNQPYVFYAPIMNDRVAERLALENRLRRAIDHEEFVLHYQPKLELKSGKIVGLEALIRWNDPQHGLVSPAAFIPVLEETGLIVDVGRWVFREAARQFIRWRDEGSRPPPIAVNVSSLELGQSDFLLAIEQARRDHPRADDGVELEITESVLMDDLQGNIDKLRSVRERGLHVAIDDFGTGYSSLGYLSRLPIDALKVDRSFVTRMTDDPQDMTIVMMIISLAHALDLKVIAEGPETVQQAQLLRLLKCDQIQGYVVAKPQPAEQVSGMLGKTVSFAPPATNVS